MSDKKWTKWPGASAKKDTGAGLPDRPTSQTGRPPGGKGSLESRRGVSDDKRSGFFKGVSRRSLDALTSLKSSASSLSSSADSESGISRVSSVDNLPPKVDPKLFARLLAGAKAGTSSLAMLLEAMFLLEQNLPPDLHVSMIKHLSLVPTMHAMINLLVSSDFRLAGAEPCDDATCQDPSSQVVSLLLSNGPQSLRRVVVTNQPILETLLQYYESCDAHEPLIIGRVSRVVYALLTDSMNETALLMSKRQFFLKGLVSHIAATSAAELLEQIFAVGYPDSFASLRFGPLNYRGVLMLAENNVYQLLADAFAAAVDRRDLSAQITNTFDNASHAITHISMRAMVVPTYDKVTCTFDFSYIEQVNSAIEELNAFHHPEAIMRMLDCAITASNKDPSRRALGFVLSAMTDLLLGFHRGCKLPQPTVRKKVTSVKLEPFEADLRKRLPSLCAILREPVSDGASSVGSVRIRIIELFVYLFAFQQKETVRILLAEQVPGILLSLMEKYPMSSVLHTVCTTCVEGSFVGRHVALKQAWLVDYDLMGRIPLLWNAQESCRHALARMSAELWKFSDKNEESVVEWVGGGKFKEFSAFCNSTLKDYLNRQRGCLGGPRPPRGAVSMLRNFRNVNVG